MGDIPRNSRLENLSSNVRRWLEERAPEVQPASGHQILRRKNECYPRKPETTVLMRPNCPPTSSSISAAKIHGEDRISQAHREVENLGGHPREMTRQVSLNCHLMSEAYMSDPESEVIAIKFVYGRLCDLRGVACYGGRVRRRVGLSVGDTSADVYGSAVCFAWSPVMAASSRSDDWG